MVEIFFPIICVSTERNNVNSDLKIWFKNLFFMHSHLEFLLIFFLSEGHLAKISSSKFVSFFFSPSVQILVTSSLLVILQIQVNGIVALVLIITVDFKKQSSRSASFQVNCQLYSYCTERASGFLNS